LAKRKKFYLPGIQDLSKEQEDARALPKEGQHLIIGGPGTGKSVLALLRSRRHHEDNDLYVFLIYNHLLNQASQQLFGKELASKQWMSWFMRIFKQTTGEPFPLLAAKPGSTWEESDWEGAFQIVSNFSELPQNDFPCLVIDEGQDMPPQFYQILVNLGYENFFVVADQNQQIEPDKNSTRQEIQDILGIDVNDVIELTYNYRNSYAIACLAREFYTGDPASPPPKLPTTSTSSSKRPMLVDYTPEAFRRIIDRILKIADNDPSKLIGIITPNNSVRERYFEALNTSDVQLDNPRPEISTYKSGDKHSMAFSESGIMVINAQSCKGLEFDTVILADINKQVCNLRNQDVVKRLYYVMVARAIDQVIMLREKGQHCAVDSILPMNNDILERK
jgi:DNA helicase II / ATP-dependent DNA helicase PcrA